MQIHLEPITAQNRTQALALHVAPGQEAFVETVSQCLDEAGQRRCWRPVGIYDRDTMVGFSMYGFFREYLPFGRLWLDRLLIDEAFQGKGYGKAALEALLDRLLQEYGRRKIYLSVIEGNDAAIALYQKFGFQFNGDLDIHGEKVMVCHARSHSTPQDPYVRIESPQ